MNLHYLIKIKILNLNYKIRDIFETCTSQNIKIQFQAKLNNKFKFKNTRAAYFNICKESIDKEIKSYLIFK